MVDQLVGPPKLEGVVMNPKEMVGMVFKHFKGGTYRVTGVHKMQHHWEGVPGGQGLLVVRYTRILYPDGGWDTSGEEFLRPLEDWEAKVWWPTLGREDKRFIPIISAFEEAPGDVGRESSQQEKVGDPTSPTHEEGSKFEPKGPGVHFVDPVASLTKFLRNTFTR